MQRPAAALTYIFFRNSVHNINAIAIFAQDEIEILYCLYTTLLNHYHIETQIRRLLICNLGGKR